MELLGKTEEFEIKREVLEPFDIVKLYLNTPAWKNTTKYYKSVYHNSQISKSQILSSSEDSSFNKTSDLAREQRHHLS